MNGWAVVGGALAAIWLADGFRLRGRAGTLSKIAPDDAPVSDDHVFLVRPGVTLDESARRAASAHARKRDLDVLDLVSPRLSTWRALVLLVAIDTAQFRADKFARGYSAGDAVLVRASVLERLGESTAPTSAIELWDRARSLKLLAATTTDLAVMPGLISPGLPLRERRRLLRAQFGDVIVPLFVIELALLALSLAFAPTWGLAALAAFLFQPLLVTLGSPLAPSDRLAQLALRPLGYLASTLAPPAPPPSAVRTASPP